LYFLALITLVVMGYAFGELAETARKTEPHGIDHTVPEWVQAHTGRHPKTTAFFYLVTQLGNFAVGDCLIALIALALIALHRNHIGGIRRADVFLWVGVTMGGRIMNALLKLLIRRERPPDDFWLIQETGLSFPSGHAVFAGVFFGMLAALIARPHFGRPAWLRVLGVIACIVMACLVAVSRVWLGVHYPTDVLGGLLLGFGWVISAWLVRVTWARWRHLQRLGRLEAQQAADAAAGAAPEQRPSASDIPEP
jgi:undecaprenyl-diphosphatase